MENATIMSTPLKDAITSTLTATKAIPYAWQAGAYGSIEKVNPTLLFQKVQTWNNQVSLYEDGKGFPFLCPACFLEMVSGETNQLLDNVTTTDYTFRFHLVDEQFDAGDDNYDQNLTVMGYRDLLKTYLVGFQPDNCSTLFFINDDQDFDHSAVYHYIIELKALFTDTKGSILDADQVRVIYKEPDTNLELNTTIVTQL